LRQLKKPTKADGSSPVNASDPSPKKHKYRPKTLQITRFFRTHKKNDLANGPFLGRSLTQTGKAPGKTNRDLKGLGDRPFLSQFKPYFDKQGDMQALIFTS
jgi:hypothetical protein